MWPLRKKFVCFVLCVFIFGGVYIIRFGLIRSTKPVPEFLSNVPRFRSSRVCSPHGLVLVNSAPQNVHRRQTIRETWGHPTVTKSIGVSVAFGVGSSPDSNIQRPLDWESETFGDVFQVPVLDTYISLSRKIIHLLKMASNACAFHPSFFIKVDDDMFVNTFALRDLIDTLKPQSSEKIIWCLVWQGMPVIRFENSKWSVSPEQYGNSTYPTYCSGSAYILNSKVLDLILKQHYEKHTTGNTSFGTFPLEDVYITGILAQETAISHFQLGSKYAFEFIDAEKIANGKTIFAHLGKKIVDVTDHLWSSVVSARIPKNHSAVGL